MITESRIQGVKIFELKEHFDPRGSLVEIARSDWLRTTKKIFRMGYVSWTKPGVTRGPHVHEEQTDWFFFLPESNGELGLLDGRYGSRTLGELQTISLNLPVSVVVPPGVIHWYINLSVCRYLVVVNMIDQLYRGYDCSEPVDEFRFED